MKKRLFSLVMTIALGLCALIGGVSVTGCNKPAEKPISILAIGSSYLRNSMDHVYPILENLGYDEIVLGNIYSSGCKINKHMENIANDTAFYEYRVVIDGKLQQKPVDGSNKKYDGGAHNAGTGECYKMSTALNERDWDYIIINQGATEGGVKDTYAQLPEYFNYIKSQVPSAKILFNVPWTFYKLSQLDEFMEFYGRDPQRQYGMILDCVKTEVEPLNFYNIIPQLTVIANCRTSNLNENRITYDKTTYGHATEDFGRYMLGLSLVHFVTGADITTVTYKPSTVTDEEKAIAVESVVNAIAKPYEVTQSQYSN